LKLDIKDGPRKTSALERWKNAYQMVLNGLRVNHDFTKQPTDV